MVNIPSGISVPGSDKAVIDIASKLKSLPNVSCGLGSKAVYIVSIAKPKNTLLPLYVPVSGATIEGRVLSVGLVEIKKLTAFANLDGITSACVPILPTVWYEFRAKQYNVDFGNGLAQFSNWKSVTDVVVFEGTIETPCPVYTPSIGVANFDKLTSTPTVFTQPANLNFQGYGIIPMSGTFEVKVNGTTIGSGNVSNGKVDFSYPGTVSNLLTKFPSLYSNFYITEQSPAKIELIIKMGTCTFINSKTVSLPSPTLPTLPCTGSFIQPNMSSLLAGIITPPSTLFVPVGLTGGKTSVPVEIYVGGTRVATQSTGFTGFDLIKILRNYYSLMGIAPNFSAQHNITIKPTATDCNIPPLIIPIPALTQALTLPTALPGCSQVATTIDSVNHPAEITDFLAPFYVYLRGIKEICKSDPTNPAFISKLPKGTIGTITLGNLSTNFYLTDGGISDIDLSKLINLPSLAGVTGLQAPQPVAILQPSAQAIPGERVGSYCTLKPVVLYGQTFYDVVHDTTGKIYSGNTYDQAKYKAQKDSRCFPALTVAPCVTIIITHSKWNDPRNAVIGFYSSDVGSRFAEGDQAWGWGGNPKPTDAEYLQKVAIPRTLEYLGGKFKSLYGRDIKKTDICGQK